MNTKTYTKANGAKIVIDGSVCYVDTPKGRAMIGSENGLRYSYTLTDDRVRLAPAVAAKTKCDRGLAIYFSGSGVPDGTLTMDDSLLSWLRDNWPVTKTGDELWRDLCPPDASQMQAYNHAWENYHNELERRMEDESLSSIPPVRPTVEKPVLTPEGDAWLKLDAMLWASNYAKRGAAREAVARAVAGESLLSAYKAAEAEWSAYCEAHAFD